MNPEQHVCIIETHATCLPVDPDCILPPETGSSYLLLANSIFPIQRMIAIDRLQEVSNLFYRLPDHLHTETGPNIDQNLQSDLLMLSGKIHAVTTGRYGDACIRNTLQQLHMLQLRGAHITHHLVRPLIDYRFASDDSTQTIIHHWGDHVSDAAAILGPRIAAYIDGTPANPWQNACITMDAPTANLYFWTSLEKFRNGLSLLLSTDAGKPVLV